MVSHGGVLHYFSEDWEDSSQYQGSYPYASFLLGIILALF
jgi:hypothetical protein